VSAGLADVDTVASQLLQARRIIRQDTELQLALSDKRASTESKVSIVEAIFSKKVDPASLAVIAHVVAQPRGRRASDALQEAAELVLDHDGRGLGRSPGRPGAKRRATKRRGRTAAEEIWTRPLPRRGDEPEVIGGARIRVGDLVMDGSVSTQLNEMRLQLAG
jgi:F-type H+-transporting ATPase subunit delta